MLQGNINSSKESHRRRKVMEHFLTLTLSLKKQPENGAVNSLGTRKRLGTFPTHPRLSQAVGLRLKYFRKVYEPGPFYGPNFAECANF